MGIQIRGKHGLGLGGDIFDVAGLTHFPKLVVNKVYTDATEQQHNLDNPSYC